MHNKDILFEEIAGKNGSIGLITLNRPQVLNALNDDMFKALGYYLREWQGKPSIKAVIVRAVEGRAFCAGGDVKSLYLKKLDNDTNIKNFFLDEYTLNRLIYHYPKPYIALLDGITIGGGAGISIHGSHRIATERMTFSMPETTIGFFPDIGASYFLSRLPYKMGIYLGLSGDRISYQDAYELGLVDHIVPHTSLDHLTQALIDTDISSKQVVTHIIHSFSAPTPSSDLLKKKEEIERSFSPQSIEKIIENLHMSSEWCQTIAKTLMTKSPTSLKVTLQEITRGEQLDFDACMDMETCMMQHFLEGHDFYEGVRALLVDKDKQPKWKPQKLEDVTESDVLKYFSCSKNETVF